MKAQVFFEYAYLAVAIYCTYEAYTLWNTPARNELYMNIIFAVAALCMYFIRRTSRLRRK
ncbi:hypothetical protein [Capnocytophaga haemolytica]